MAQRKSKPLEELHPFLREWFSRTYPGLSEIQLRALPHTMAGENTLILAPTGSGKTLAAFLSVLSRLAERAEAGKLPNAICAIYVSPLKALDNDIYRNLGPAVDAINAQLPAERAIQMEVRTGDTAFKDRNRQRRRRPHLTLTTPESLTSILSQAAWREKGFDPDTVVVDEIHSFAENKRGSLLALCLERLEDRIGRPLQRIGVSATAWPVEAMARLLCGNRPCAVASVDVKKAHRLEVVPPAGDAWLPPAGYNSFRIAPTVASLVENAGCSLIFLTTRSAVERLGLALNFLLPQYEDKIAVHHGSVDRKAREEIEDGLKTGYWRAVVASSSLEMGVDFSAVDQVVLVGTPRGVSRALQRLGRSGHRVDGVASGALVPLSLPDLVECVALREAARAGRLDALRIPSAPLDVLAQVLLGMSIEREWSCDEAFALVRRSGPYLNLLRKDFDDVLVYLSGEGKVLGPYGKYGKIELRDGKFRVASAKIARNYYLNVGVISTDFEMRVISSRNRQLGAVEEAFIASLRPDEAFIMGGKPVRLKRIHGNIAVVEPAAGEQVKTPRWMGNKMPLTAQMAEEELHLRRELRRHFETGGVQACRAFLKRDYRVDDNVASRIAFFIGRHSNALPVPTDSPVLVERVVNGRNMLLLFHVVAGRAVNRSLAWVAGARLTHGGSVMANVDDHSFLLSVDSRIESDAEILHELFCPDQFMEDLRRVLSTTETLGTSFRHIAEIGQLLPRRTLGGGDVNARAATWNGSLLYTTLLEHEPDHPLVREAIREVLEDQCDAERAVEEAARIYESPLEVYDLPRPSPFALPLFAAFNREVLVAPDPDRALDDLVASIYGAWETETSPVAAPTPV